MLRATWRIALLLVPLASAAAQTEAELAVAHALLEAFHGPDYAALAELVDFPRHAAERAARGEDLRPWDQLDERDQKTAAQLLLRGWVTSERSFAMRATFVSATEVADPDAGLGPVPDRRILRLLLRHQASGEYRDALLTLTREPRIADLEQGPVYLAGSNPAGESGLLPRAVLSVPAPRVVAWDPAVEPAERGELARLVDALLAAPDGKEHQLARETLHRNPHAATAVLLERLLAFERTPPPDAAAPSPLVDALERITGRAAAWLAPSPPGGGDAPGGLDPQLVQDWMRWHARNGWSFTPAPVEGPPGPTVAAGTGSSEPLDLDRWEERLREQQARAAAAESGDPPAGEAEPADPSSAPPAVEPPPQPPPAPAPASPPPTPRPSPRDLLFEKAAALSFRLGGREVQGREVEGELPPSLREALNAWADTCTRLQLSIVASGHAEHLVVGRAPQHTLQEAAETLDRTAALLDESIPLVAPRLTRAVVAVIFDEEGVRSEAWPGLLDDLVARQVLFEETADRLRDSPSGLMRRQTPMFIQITAPLVEDPEFEYANELVGKFTQCLATARVGELPRTLLWGLDYVAEEHFFRSIYQFDTTGFVFTADHFDWPVRTKQYLEKKGVSLAKLAAEDGAAGQPVRPQMVTWAALAYLRAERPEALATLLSDLSAIQAAADPRRRAAEWRGDRDQTLAALARTLDGLKVRELVHWLDRD